MVEFSKKSWHYRLLESASKLPTSEGLCPYARAVIFTVIYLITLVMCGGWVLLLVINAVLLVFGLEFLNSFVYLFLLFGFLATPVGFVITWVTIRINPYRTRKEPSIVAEYYKALHDKVCPDVTFKE